MRTLASASRLLLCAAAALLPGAAVAEEAVIVASTAPGQTPGTVIGDGEPLRLPDGSTATLLFRSGRTLKLRGPFDAALPTGGGSAGGPDLFRMQGVDVSVVGGSRDMAPSARRAMDGGDILIDPQRSATYCIGPRDTLRLRRPATGGELGIRRGGNVRTTAWPTGALEAPWPDDLMVDDGDRFDFLDAAGHKEGSATFRRFNTAPSSEGAWVAEMFVRGCADQAQPALREVARRSVTPEIYLSADQGRHPVYKAGSPVRLVIQTNLDGQLYCFARTAENDTIPIFPGPARGGARIEAHAPLTIPGDRTTVGLRAGGSGGINQVRCYFADRDIASELPAPLLDRNMTPLSGDLAADLQTVFSAVPMARIATASLTIKAE